MADFKERWPRLESLLREREENYPRLQTWNPNGRGADLEEAFDLFLETCKLYRDSDELTRGEMRRLFLNARHLQIDLFGFSGHALKLFEKTGETDWLEMALIAHSIEDKSSDFRDTYCALGEIYGTAVERDVRPWPHFLRIAAISSEDVPPHHHTSMRKFIESFESSAFFRESVMPRLRIIEEK